MNPASTVWPAVDSLRHDDHGKGTDSGVHPRFRLKYFFIGRLEDEAWSFIPPNQLRKLMDIAHNDRPTGLSHQYCDDGAISVADVWLGPGTGESKTYSERKTLLLFGEGRGGGSTLGNS